MCVRLEGQPHDWIVACREPDIVESIDAITTVERPFHRTSLSGKLGTRVVVIERQPDLVGRLPVQFEVRNIGDLRSGRADIRNDRSAQQQPQSRLAC